jgi:hypothetical protein
MIKMNIYVFKKDLDVFLENLKENKNIDDFILDKVCFGKQKINIFPRKNHHKIIESLIPILPNHSMITDKMQSPSKEYILCIGEMNLSYFPYFEQQDFHFSIITQTENKIRFNSWVHLSKVEEWFRSNTIESFSSINGKIEESCYFVFEAERDINPIFEVFSKLSNEFIIRDNKFYVKLFLKDFTKSFEQIKPYYKKVEIVDK